MANVTTVSWVTCLGTLWLKVGQGHSWITCVAVFECVCNWSCEGQRPQHTRTHADTLHTVVLCCYERRSCVGVHQVRLCDPWTSSSDSGVLSLSRAPRRPVNVSARRGCSEQEGNSRVRKRKAWGRCCVRAVVLIIAVQAAQCPLCQSSFSRSGKHSRFIMATKSFYFIG